MTERLSRIGVGGVAIHALHIEPPRARAAVVVVHGMVVASNGTLPLARALAGRGFSVHIPDLPGFGRSDKARRALDVEGLAEVLGRWMGEAGLEGAALIGNSFGTQVAGALAAQGGGGGRLVLLSPTIDPRYRRGWVAALPRGRSGGVPLGGSAGWLQSKWRDLLVRPPGRGAPPTLRSLLWREYLAAGPARALSTYRHALRDDLSSRMGGLGVPVLVLRAEFDRVVSPAWAEALAAAAPDGRFAQVRGTGHDAQFDAATTVVEALGPFLLEGGGPGR